MKTFTYTIRDRAGIHARPAGILCRLCREMAPNRITLLRDGQEADCSKILEVMGLDVKCGETVMLRAEGPGEETAAAELSEWFHKNL